MKSIRYILILLLFNIGCVRNSINIHFIDVGYGNSILITSLNLIVLIDGGDHDKGEKVTQYLHEKNINKIDILIATHPHPDHIGGLFEAVKEYEIGELLTERDMETTEEYSELHTLIKQNNIKCRKVKRGDKFKKEGIEFIILNPENITPNLNDSSMVIKIKYRNRSVLLTSDIGSEVCNELIEVYGKNLSSNILIIPHHGKSGGMQFIKAVNPDIAVISTGESKWKGPDEGILSYYNELNIPVFRTDNKGDIIIDLNKDVKVWLHYFDTEKQNLQ